MLTVGGFGLDGGLGGGGLGGGGREGFFRFIWSNSAQPAFSSSLRLFAISLSTVSKGSGPDKVYKVISILT